MKRGEGMKPILVVEDEAIMRESLRDWLTESGYQVATVENGEEALETITEQDFGLLILDLRLPGKDGLHVLKEARARRPELRGIIITAYPSLETAVEAMKGGAVDYLAKPVDLNQLEKLIQETLGPVQVEIRPSRVEKVEEAPEVPEEIPIQLREVSDKSTLIQALLEIQRENRWLSKGALEWVSRKLDVPLTQIYNIATFYKAFSLIPQGRHSVSVCTGTACHVRGAQRLLDKATETLKVKPGGTSKDLRFSLNTVNCLGCCALGPVIEIDNKYYGNPPPDELKKIFSQCE
jgi:NADH-quinone oxidoreductase subunit E